MGELLGRFHPLIVHLPVGILVAAFLMELASRNASWAYLKQSIPFVLLLALLTAILSWFTGWVMPKEGEFNERLLSLHFWFAIGTTIGTALVYFLAKSSDQRKQKFYFPLFLVTMVSLTLTGHFGGSLTHGEDHLTQPLGEQKRAQVTDVNALLAYPDLIAPLLKQKCTSCHNAGKKKGSLDLSTPEMILKGGEGGLVLSAGNIAGSPLIQRLHLPLVEKEHMPPKGKKQLSNNEVALLEWWVAEGASFDKAVGDIKQSEEIEKILKGYEQSAASINTSGLTIPTAKQLSRLGTAGIQVMPHDADSPLVNVSLNRDSLLTKRKLKKLNDIAKNIFELDLSYTNMDDDMMSVLANFKNLQKLKLQQTAVTSKGLRRLEKLQGLTYLNLYGTNVDDKSFESLEKLMGLSSLFLWQTKVTDDKVASYQEAHPLVDISYEIDESLFGDARLKPPIIATEEDIFEDSLRISMDLNFSNVQIYYTLDGSIPDSTSILYDSSFVLTKTAVIKAVSAKQGWTTSEIAERVVTQAGFKIASVQLQKAPNDKYSAEGAKSLIDFEKGTIRFAEGNWLGFEGENMLATLDLGTQEIVSNVVVSALEETGSYIFFPKGIEVSTSTDGKKYGLAKKIAIPITDGPAPAELKSYLVQFESRDARYVQVKVLGTLKNPEWHAAPGAKNWIFIDELLVN